MNKKQYIIAMYDDPVYFYQGYEYTKGIANWTLESKYAVKFATKEEAKDLIQILMLDHCLWNVGIMEYKDG